MRDNRRADGVIAFGAILMLGLGVIAILMWATLSAVHAAENERCKPFNEGYNNIVALALVAHGDLYEIPKDKMKAFADPLKDQWDGLDGESAYFLDLHIAFAIFVKHGDQLCSATLKAGTPGTDL